MDVPFSGAVANMAYAPGRLLITGKERGELGPRDHN